jgi:hypothetical protein
MRRELGCAVCQCSIGSWENGKGGGKVGREGEEHRQRGGFNGMGAMPNSGKAET